MPFVLVTFFVAFLIEGLGTVVSIIGLSALFGSNLIIIALAVALDAGKLVVVSLLYTYWQQLNRLMKAYALVAATVTMTITSAGAAGYLAGEFQKAVIGVQEVGLKVDILKEERAKLEARKKQIDDQVANLPSNYSRGRISLIRQFEDEQKQITSRLAQISEELPGLQLSQVRLEAKAGPLLSIARALDVPVEVAVKWVILMIVFVFDPLAVFLVISGNFLLQQARRRRDGPAPAGSLETKAAPGPVVEKVLVEAPQVTGTSTSQAAVDGVAVQVPPAPELVAEKKEPPITPVPRKSRSPSEPRRATRPAKELLRPPQAPGKGPTAGPVISSLDDVVPDKETNVDSTEGARQLADIHKFYSRNR